MNASVEHLSVKNDDGRNDMADRLYALRLAKEIFPRGPEARLLEAANLFHEFLKEDQAMPHTSQLIETAFVETDGLMPTDPAIITATARRLRDYVRTGDLPEPPSEAP